MSLTESRARHRSLQRDSGKARCPIKADEIPVLSVCKQNSVQDMKTAIGRRETSGTVSRLLQPLCLTSPFSDQSAQTATKAKATYVMNKVWRIKIAVIKFKIMATTPLVLKNTISQISRN